MTAPSPFGELNLSIIGLGTQYPPHDLRANALSTISNKFYPQSESYVILYLFSIAARIQSLSKVVS